ncbi:unnamed protein product [Angiostrongylus costaricensis]|uniref:Sorbitol dehydrogenase n=1 Tax=Angiostrongylus costaricensis TaxID=334426 RepID=A0A158PHX0_ANGCS|nr:unnamed protein product [Angiostrongylus costaricensis]
MHSFSVHTVGICGSDVHYWTHGSIGSFVVKKPMVLGHETSGTVFGLGSGVKGFKVGDRIALEPGIPCRGCEQCKTGRYNLCPAMRFFATPPVHGSLARYVVLDADLCYKLPDNVSYEEGPIGILCMMTAKAAGVSEVVIIDLESRRLELARTLGADHIICVKEMSPSDVRSAVIDHLGTEPDVTIECTGAHTCIETAIRTTRSGGVIVLVGVGALRAELPIIESALREVDIRGVFRYANCYPSAINLVSSGRIDLSGLTRAHYTLENTQEAFHRALKADVVKVFISCQK